MRPPSSCPLCNNSEDYEPINFTADGAAIKNWCRSCKHIFYTDVVTGAVVHRSNDECMDRNGCLQDRRGLTGYRGLAEGEDAKQRTDAQGWHPDLEIIRA